MKKTQTRNRGEIWLANLNPNKGAEPGKTRPVLLLQHQILLDAGHPTTLIAPLSTRLIEGAEPLRIRIKAREALDKDSDVLIDQLRAIDNQRLTHGPLLTLSDTQMLQIEDAIMDVLGIG